MKQKIYNLIILDRSGSMIDLQKTAVNSVNETLQTILESHRKEENQEHYVTFVSFNHEVNTLYSALPAEQTKQLTLEDYQPCGMTALHDAIGMAVTELRSKITPEDRVLATIITDGWENSSKEYNAQMIKTMIDELKASGWVFVYIGANHDVVTTAASISIHNTMIFEATTEDFDRASKRTDQARRGLFHKMAKINFDSKAVDSTFYEEDEESK